MPKKMPQPSPYLTTLQVHIIEAVQGSGYDAEWHSLDWWAGYLEHVHGSPAVLKRAINTMARRGVFETDPPLYRLTKEWRA
jgi:hypothetical protein